MEGKTPMDDVLPLDNIDTEIYAFFDSAEKPLSWSEFQKFWHSLGWIELEYYRAVDLKTGKLAEHELRRRIVVTNRLNPNFEKRGTVFAFAIKSYLVLFDDGRHASVLKNDVLVLN